MDGFGYINLWGFSPAVDLMDELETLSELPVEDDINLLIIGSGDGRHVFKTLAQLNRHPERKVNMYIMENSFEVVARQILFLKLIAEKAQNVGLQERSEMFLELFGNLHVRPQTWRYVERAAQELIVIITNLEEHADKLPFVDFTNLQFRERDALESVFKFWKAKEEFNIGKCWELRVRRYLGERYDSRFGAFDWDYNMKLLERGGEIIHVNEYKKWRNTGNAFELRDADYTTPNKTLATGVVISHEGDRHARKGYWGDIVTGPLISFGTESESKCLFEKRNGTFVKTAKDVSLHNVTSLLDQLINPANGWLVLDESIKVRVTFLSRKCIGELHNKSFFRGAFHLVFCSNSMSHVLTQKMSTTLRPKAVILMESAKYLLDFKKEQILKFWDQMHKVSHDLKCKLSRGTADDHLVKFVSDGPSETESSSV